MSLLRKMSRSGALSAKRKRPGTDPPGVVADELTILNLIKSKMDSGIWTRHIKFETKLADTVVNKSIKSLLAKNLIKEVKNIQNKTGKHYMAVEYEPSKEITGGDFYTDGHLDIEFINMLRKFCLVYVKKQKVATLEGVHSEIKKKRLVTFDISSQQVGEVLNSMVLDDEIIEVKSTGVEDYRLIPFGQTCYRFASGITEGAKTGAFASIPCGACSMIGLCTPDGLISPSTCVYYTNWLKIEF